MVAGLGGCAEASEQTPGRVITEYAHLKQTRQAGPVYFDAGTVTGSINMTMTLTMNEAIGGGSYKAIAPTGTLYGNVAVSSSSVTSRRDSAGTLIYRFSGSATVTHGTGLYRNGLATALRVHGELVTSEHRLNLVLSGHLYY